jgi:hypothetical protein
MIKLVNLLKEIISLKSNVNNTPEDVPIDIYDYDNPDKKIGSYPSIRKAEVALKIPEGAISQNIKAKKKFYYNRKTGKKYIFKLAKKKVDEDSVASGAGSYMTPKAFTKNKNAKGSEGGLMVSKNLGWSEVPKTNRWTIKW